MARPRTELEKYQQEVDRLYHEYLKLWQESGGEIPAKLPGIWRSQYEPFELIVNLTDTEENVVCKIDKFKKEILLARDERLNCLENAYSRKVVVNDPPIRSDGKKTSYKKTIEKAEIALDAYRQKQKNARNFEIACDVFGINGTVTDEEQKSAERKVSQYLSHAEMLIVAAGNSTFLDSLSTPLLKK